MECAIAANLKSLAKRRCSLDTGERIVLMKYFPPIIASSRVRIDFGIALRVDFNSLANWGNALSGFRIRFILEAVSGA